jgi:hypothetical protein
VATAALISVEGVLAASLDAGALFPASAPIRHGIRLLAALSASYKAVLAAEEPNREHVEYWLKQQGLGDFYGVLLTRREIEVEMGHTELRLSQFDYVRSLGFTLDLVIDTDPLVIREVMQRGAVGLLFAHPQYLRPEFRPDTQRGLKTWQDIERESEEQALLKSGDVRLANLYEEVATE